MITADTTATGVVSSLNASHVLRQNPVIRGLAQSGLEFGGASTAGEGAQTRRRRPRRAK